MDSCARYEALSDNRNSSSSINDMLSLFGVMTLSLNVTRMFHALLKIPSYLDIRVALVSWTIHVRQILQENDYCPG